VTPSPPAGDVMWGGGGHGREQSGGAVVGEIKWMWCGVSSGWMRLGVACSFKKKKGNHQKYPWRCYTTK
jgi:hypothetical protein